MPAWNDRKYKPVDTATTCCYGNDTEIYYDTTVNVDLGPSSPEEPDTKETFSPYCWPVANRLYPVYTFQTKPNETVSRIHQRKAPKTKRRPPINLQRLRRQRVMHLGTRTLRESFEQP